MIQNKHIIRFSFIGLFLNIIANIVLYRYYMIEEVVLKQATDNNTYLADLYKKEIWDTNEVAILKLNDNKYDNLMIDKDFITYARESIEFFKNTSCNAIVYDKKGKKILTSVESNVVHFDKYNSFDIYGVILLNLDKYFLRDYIIDNPINEAYKGKASHSLITRSIITNENDDQYEKSYISSFIPIINTKNGGYVIEGVIEITTDITEQWDNITYLEKRIVIAFLIIFFVFFMIVMYNTNYAQSIINKQFETNRALEDAKTKAETESFAKTEFLANVSHELRTPLNAIIGFSEIIIAETYGPIANAQYKEYISDINNSGKHLLSVINDILDFSKASADKLKVEKVELDLNKLASSSMRFVKPRADSASISLIENFPLEHVVIQADPKRLKQALLNLLSNSVKFTPSGGSVTLSIKRNIPKKLVYIVVTDTGIGMDDSNIPKALSTFGQVDNKLSRKYEGTGLGLPLTKKLIELMEGSFNLESKPGKGTKVTITFTCDNSIEI
ncbi:MAG: sensor histidine kinase [Rickettsiales bacterium]|nr:MAG: sensor histidine kinase [Rickettsiales bacterium]